MVGGILLGYLIGNLSIGEVGGWRTMYGASFIPAIILGLGMVRPCRLYGRVHGRVYNIYQGLQGIPWRTMYGASISAIILGLGMVRQCRVHGRV